MTDGPGMRKGDEVTIPAGTDYQRCSKRRGGFDRQGLARRTRTVVVVDVSPGYGPNHPPLVYWRGSGGYLFAVDAREVQT